jgi:hypothetical protein
MGFLVKESVRTGPDQYWERAVFKRPFASKDAAIKACEKKELPDNQPFVEDTEGFVIYVGKKGSHYAGDYSGEGSGTSKKS